MKHIIELFPKANGILVRDASGHWKMYCPDGDAVRETAANTYLSMKNPDLDTELKTREHSFAFNIADAGLALLGIVNDTTGTALPDGFVDRVAEFCQWSRL